MAGFGDPGGDDAVAMCLIVVTCWKFMYGVMEVNEDEGLRVEVGRMESGIFEGCIEGSCVL